MRLALHRCFALLLLAAIGSAAHAQQAYRCTDAQGRVAYQDRPCASGQRQQALRLEDDAGAPAATTPAPSAEDAPSAPPAPARAQPAPLPSLYVCAQASDPQKTYLSDTPQPAPYLAPLGVLGYPGRGLGAMVQPSAPEANRHPPVVRSPLAGGYTWVQDACRPATHEEICREVQRRYDDNHRKLRSAFPSDRPPLERREAELRAQLDGC
ncbi:hypothetical protein MBSD_n0510 [Mizugakiibacter sediminis]|uniref:DUF4124 domain-containing protein n=1 Tax=Mizugakiibacter sediminis TaxID=1475481 RepID=A0A0K8QKN2_9GAMM|nr:DUF4124 domain-containing protein [Mizugakiibacter sediminis]GAP65221.1 hypothetical protein MBSD_n0510 [Mizugakiibacter sediminis]